MRVLQLHNYHESKGGDEEVIAHERQLLESAGHEVSEYALPAAVKLALPPIRAGAKAVWNQEAYRQVGRRIDTFGPDIVHVHDPYPIMSPSVFWASSRREVPTVVTMHNYRYTCISADHSRDGLVCEDCVGTVLKLPGIRHRCYHDSIAASTAMTVSLDLHRRMRTFHHQVSRYLVLTDFARRLLIRDGYPAEKIAVKPNSVRDPGVWPTPSGDRYVAFLGRLLETKGVRTLLDAWRQVPPGLSLHIAGDGPLRSLVEDRARTDPSIRYLGWLDSPERVLELMGGADAVMVPSQWYEGGAPLVVLRSLSVGTPVVVSDLENICGDVVADDAGFTFPMGDSSALARLLRSLAEDPARAHDARLRARASYEKRYAPDRGLELLEAAYRGVLADRRGPRRRG